jgi:hypothetical protein
MTPTTPAGTTDAAEAATRPEPPTTEATTCQQRHCSPSIITVSTKHYVTLQREPDFAIRTVARVLLMEGGEPKSFNSRGEAASYAASLRGSLSSVVRGDTKKAIQAAKTTARLMTPPSASRFAPMTAAEDRAVASRQPSGGVAFKGPPRIDKARSKRTAMRRKIQRAALAMAYTEEGEDFSG